ncbi:MAG: transcriptional repressor [Pseudomonadota bacterium]
MSDKPSKPAKTPGGVRKKPGALTATEASPGAAKRSRSGGERPIDSTVAVAFASHDHHACISGGLDAADRYCAENGLRLTPVRRRVLELLLEDHRALGAYEILEVLGREGLGHQPPVAYRALGFLVAEGLAHKIERLNAFVSCARPGAKHTPAFLICRDCDAVAETALDPSALEALGARSGFTLDRAAVEALGRCPRCQEAAGPGA